MASTAIGAAGEDARTITFMNKGRVCVERTSDVYYAG